MNLRVINALGFNKLFKTTVTMMTQILIHDLKNQHIQSRHSFLEDKNNNPTGATVGRIFDTHKIIGGYQIGGCEPEPGSSTITTTGPLFPEILI